MIALESSTIKSGGSATINCSRGLERYREQGSFWESVINFSCHRSVNKITSVGNQDSAEIQLVVVGC